MGILITGGTGFIGAQVARVLAEQGERPVVFDINDRKTLLRGVEDKVTAFKAGFSALALFFSPRLRPERISPW